MPVIDFYAVWTALREAFHLVAQLLAMFGLGEWGGRVMAALLFATFFFLAGVFRKTRRIVGTFLALLFILVVALAVI